MGSFSVRSSIDRTQLVEEPSDDHDHQGPSVSRTTAGSRYNSFIQISRRLYDRIDHWRSGTRSRASTLHVLFGVVGLVIVLTMITLAITGAFRHNTPAETEQSNDGGNADRDISKNKPNPQGLIQPNNTVIDMKNDEILELKKELGQLRNLTNEIIDKLKHDNKRLLTENAQLRNISLEDKEKQDEWLKFKTRFDNQSWGSLLLLTAITQKDDDLVKVLVQVGADVNGRNNNSQTALVIAAKNPDKTFSIRIIKYLIDQGAEVYSGEEEGEPTFLYQLVSAPTTLTPPQFNDMAEFLISRNLSEMYSTPSGLKFVTPLMLAVKNVDVQNATLAFLHEHGVTFTTKDNDGDSLLKYALEGKRSVTLLSALINYGADWNITNNYRFTLLHFAAYFGHTSGLKYLVSVGVNVNAMDAHGTTPLHIVAFHGRENIVETVRFLMEHGANATIENQSGKTPLDDLKLNRKIYGTVKEQLIQIMGGDIDDNDHNDDRERIHRVRLMLRAHGIEMGFGNSTSETEHEHVVTPRATFI